MPLIAFFAFVFGLVAIAAGLGFLTILYAVRPKLFADLMRSIHHPPSTITNVTAGLIIATLLPIVAGTAYAASGASWMVSFFGAVGTWFWAWVAGAYLFGMLVACVLRTPTRQ